MTSELPGMGALKRAAIDAYMKENNFTAHNGNHYISIQHQENDRRTTYVSLPDAEGNGGGHTTGYVDYRDPLGIKQQTEHFDHGNAYSTTFDSIRQILEDLFTPWGHLPNSDQISTEEDEFYRFLASVSLFGITGNATMAMGPDGHYKLETRGSYAAGEINAELTQLTHNIAGLSGHGISAFKEGFLSRFEPVLSSLLSIGFGIGDTIGIERGLTEVAQAHIAQIIGEATTAFSNIAKENAPHAAHFVLDLVSAAIPFAGSFVAASQAKDRIIQALSFAADQTKTVVQKPTPCTTFLATMTGLRDGLASLNESYRRLEQQLADHCLRLKDDFHLQAPSYDLIPKPISLAPPGQADLRINDYAMEEIDNSLRIIHEELERGLSLARKVKVGTGWVRDARIGLRADGPSAEFNQVLGELLYRLKDLANDTEISRKNLRAWHKAMQEADANVLAELEEIVREVNSLSLDVNPRQRRPSSPLPPQIRID